jgi:argonaute-like protein implicated in RNA metabolism and viral defense
VLSLTGDKIQESRLLFDESDTSATNPQVYWGLRNFGPYQKGPAEIKLAIVCPSSKLDQIRHLIQDLNNGSSIFPGGMPQFFRCKLNVTQEVTTDSVAIEDYQQKTIMFTKKFSPTEFDVVLAYIPKTGKYFANTPYYRLKAIFTTAGFASQMITQATFANLKWSYINLASAIFSKSGRIPWVLENEMEDTDMVLGISISNVISSKKRAGDLARYVGYVNVFDSYGKWLFFEGTARPYNRDQNLEMLKELYTNSVQKCEAIKKKKPKKIAIHYYKKFSKEEREASKRILDDLVSGANLAFISLDTSHPYRVYDRTTQDGSFPRGNYIYFRDNEVLLSTTGATDVAGRRMGTPKLVHIQLVQDPVFTNIDKITRQVFALTRLDWATATPLIREPVTLMFSEAVAYLTAAISEQEWEGMMNPQINSVLNGKPWFI